MKQIIKNTIAILDPRERKKMLLLILLDISVSILDIAFLALLLFIVHFYTEAAWSDKLSFLPAWLADHNSLWPIGSVFLLFCVKNLGSFLVYKAQCKFRFDIAMRISRNNLLQYLEGNYNDYVDTDSSVHAGHISQQPLEFCQNILEGFQQCITELTLVIVSVIAVLLFNAKLFLLLLVLLLPPVVIMAWLTRRKLNSARMQIKTSGEIMWQHVLEAIAGFVESNVYDKTMFFTNRYSRAQHTLSKHLATLRTIQGAPSRLAEVFAVFGLLGLIVISHFSGNTYGTQFVTLGAFLAAAYKIIPGVARILSITGQIRTYEFAVNGLVKKKTAGVKKEATDHDRQSNARQNNGHLAERQAANIRSVTCNHIDFHYGKNKILSDFNLSIGPGDFLGIYGNSGKGKTTLLNILLGFLEPEQGEVLFNEIIRDSKGIRGYWKHIAYVKQQPFIINDTILTNITLDEEEYEAERLKVALTLSGLDEFIEKSPGGVLNRISENGKNVSGGQRQRIAIARALYKKADLVILDEPFSELDEASEERLLVHFKQLAGEGRSVILITHNKKSLSYCNKTISLDEQ